jgi:hypothetical protein
VAAYPNLPLPKVRYWVIFNNQILPQVTSPTWVGVVSRSVEMGTRSATVTAMRHLFAMAEISRLKRGATVEVRLVAVPDDFVPPQAGTFKKETMNALWLISVKRWEPILQPGSPNHRNLLNSEQAIRSASPAALVTF